MNDRNVTFENNRGGPLYTAKFHLYDSILCSLEFILHLLVNQPVYLRSNRNALRFDLKNLVSRGPARL